MLTNLLQRANQVAAETINDANSAARIGTLFRDLILQLAFGFDPDASYSVGQNAFFQGRLVTALAATTPGQSPATHPAKWTDYTADADLIDITGPDLGVKARELAKYLSSELNARIGNTGLVVLPDADENTAGVVRRADLDSFADPDENARYMTPQLVIELINRFLVDTLNNNQPGPETLDTTVNRGAVTAVPIQTGGYRADSFALLQSAVHVLVERIVTTNGRTYSEIARLPISAIAPVDEPDPVATEPVFSFGEVYEQVDADEGAPVAPSNLVILRTAGTLNAVASWRDNNADETGHRFEVSDTLSGTYTLLIELGPNVTVLPLNGLSLNTPKYYRVCAVRNGVSSAYSNIYKLTLTDFVVTFGLYSLATPPVLVKQLVEGGVTVSPGVGQLGALVRLPGGSVPTTDDYDMVTFSFIDPTGVPQGWDYPDGEPQSAPYYPFPRPGGGLIHAGTYPMEFEIIKGGQVIQRNTFSTTFSPAVTVPTKPDNFTVTRNSQNNGLLFTWVDRSNNEEVFTIERQASNGSWSFFTSAGANETGKASLTNPMPADGTKFRIRAANSIGASDNVEATLTAQAPVTILQVRARRLASSSQIEIEAITSRTDRVLWRFSVNANEVLTNQFPDVNQPALGEPLKLGYSNSQTLFFAARPLTNTFGAIGRFAVTNPPTFSTDWQTLTTI